jgi:hypothetical protein
MTLLVGLILLPGACGISLSVSQGNEAGNSGYTTRYEAADDASVHDSTTLTESGLSRALIASGSLDELHWVSNAWGDYAEVRAKVNNAASYSYSYNLFPGSGGGWWSGAVWAEEWLTATSADYINAYAYASNSAGDQAKAEMTVDHGSINGYYAAAYSGPAWWLGVDRGAFVQQTANKATGNNILAQTFTNDAPGDRAGSRTEVKSGTLNGYSARANGLRYQDGLRAAGVIVDFASASAPQGSINQLTWAQDYWGDRVEVGTAINKGYLYSYPYSAYYPSLAYALGDWDWTGAVQSVDASSWGTGNYFTSYGKFSDPVFGSLTYNQAYASGRLRFWNSAATRPDFAGEWHGILW